MALESATYVDGLVITNPTGSDSISQGDDHIRLIKTVLKNSLPNVTTATTPIVSVSHNIPVSSSYMRSATYATTAQTITHSKVSATSTLYITYNGFVQLAFNFDAGTATAHIRLSNSSGTLIVGTTDDIQCFSVDDVDHSANPTWDSTVGVNRTWKVTSANCPDGTTGANTFTIYSKCDPVADGGTTFYTGTMTCLEIEE
tara:strand:+ start:241 stop:840 length:600 start_codon:yes stop_codon:yes gene_type:complete